MKIARRALLALPFLAAVPARAAGVRLEDGPEGMVALTGPGVRRALLLPGTGARLLPAVACGGEAVTVASFALEGGGARMEWGVLAMVQDGAVALLALEPLAWRGAGGGRMATRLTGTGDRRHLLCQRDTAVPASPTLWRREAWTDTLAWQAPAGLADAPVREPMAGTRQKLVALWRRRAARLVAQMGAGNATVLSPALLVEAGLQVEGFSLSASLQPSMRQPSGVRSIV